MTKQQPTMVCLCGSTRFKKEFADANLRESLAGRIVFTVPCYDHADGITLTDEQVGTLCELHLRKIERSDEVLVIDALITVCLVCGRPAGSRSSSEGRHQSVSHCCNGLCAQRPYVGEATRREIEYAVIMGKKVRYWSQECERA